MSVLATFPFTDEVNYNLFNAQIQSGKAKLAIVPNPNQEFTQSFSSDVGFTYDSAKAEFAGGLVRQKDLRNTYAVFAANFNLGLDSNWTPVVPVQIGTPTNTDGKLQCLGSETNTGLAYTAAGLASMTNKGTIRFKFTPHYSGPPAANEGSISVRPSAGNIDRIMLRHGAGSGTLLLDLYNSAGVAVCSTGASSGSFSNWTTNVAGTEYEISIVFDGPAGTVQIFINGVSFGLKTPGAFTRTGTATIVNIGSNPTLAACDSTFDDVICYSEALWTSGYTPGYSIADYAYAASSVALPNFSYTGVGTIQAVESSVITEVGSPRYIVGGKYWNGSSWVVSNGSYAQANPSATVIANLTSLVVTGATSVPVSVIFNDSNSLSSVDLISVFVEGQKYSSSGYVETAQALNVEALDSYEQDVTTDADTDVLVIIKIDGILYWFNGTAWVVSNGTAAEANTAEDINSNLVSLDFGSNSSVIIRWLLATDVISKTPELDISTVGYNFGGIAQDPATCLVWGYARKINGAPISGAKVTFELKQSDATQYVEATQNVIMAEKIVVTTDVNGYFETDLIRNSEYEGTDPVYLISIEKGSVKTSKISTAGLEFSVPDADNKDITDLLTMP